MRRYLNYLKPIIAIIVILALVFSLVPALYGMNRAGRSVLQLSKQAGRLNHRLPSSGGPAIFSLFNKSPINGASINRAPSQFQSNATGPAHLFDGSLGRQPKKLPRHPKMPKIKEPKVSAQPATSVAQPGSNPRTPAKQPSFVETTKGRPYSVETTKGRPYSVETTKGRPALKPVSMDDLLRYGQRRNPAHPGPNQPAIAQIVLPEPQPLIQEGNAEILLKTSVHQGMVQQSAQPDFAVIQGRVSDNGSVLLPAENNQAVAASNRAHVSYSPVVGNVESSVASLHEVVQPASAGTIERSPKPTTHVATIQHPSVRIPEKTVQRIVTPAQPEQPRNEGPEIQNGDADNRRHPIRNPELNIDGGARRAHGQQERPDPRIRLPRIFPIMPVPGQQPQPTPRPAPRPEPVVPNPGNVVPPLRIIYPPMPKHNEPTPKPKKPTPKPVPKPKPKKVTDNVEPAVRPMSKELAIADLRKLVIADRNSAGAVRFGKEHRRASQVEKKSVHLAPYLPEDLAQLREEFIKAHGGNMHKEGDYAGCNHQAYEKIMAAIRKYEALGLLASRV